MKEAPFNRGPVEHHFYPSMPLADTPYYHVHGLSRGTMLLPTLHMRCLDNRHHPLRQHVLVTFPEIVAHELSWATPQTSHVVAELRVASCHLSLRDSTPMLHLTGALRLQGFSKSAHKLLCDAFEGQHRRTSPWSASESLQSEFRLTPTYPSAKVPKLGVSL